MKKVFLLFLLFILCSCSNDNVEYLKVSNISHLDEKLEYIETSFKYEDSQNATLLFDNKECFFSQDVIECYTRENLTDYISGDTFELRINENNEVDFGIVHEAYILELENSDNGFYSKILDRYFTFFEDTYIILNKDFAYKSLKEVNIEKIYVSVKENDYANGEYIIDTLYCYNPRVNNTICIKKVIYNKGYSSENMLFKDNRIINSANGLSKSEYDEEFFKNNTLIVLFYRDNSGSISRKIKRVFTCENELYVIVDTQVPSIGDCAMAFSEIIIEVEKIDTDLTLKNFGGKNI